MMDILIFKKKEKYCIKREFTVCDCFKLTHDEYETGNIDRVAKYIEEN